MPLVRGAVIVPGEAAEQSFGIAADTRPMVGHADLRPLAMTRAPERHRTAVRILDDAGVRLEQPVAHHHAGRLGVEPPQQRAQPGLQFDEVERLGQVVVRAAVQSFHDVVHLRERGQHQRGCSDAGAAQGANQIQPVAVGQPAVDDQRVMLLPYPIGTPLKRR